MKKIRKSRLFIVGIFIYILFQVVLVLMSKSTETLALEAEELKVKISTEGIFIRDEYLVKSNQNGIVETIHDEGEKVKKSQDIAYIYKDNKIDKINSQIENLSKEIKDLKLQLDNNSSKLNKEVLENQMKTKKEQKKILEGEKEKIVSYLKTDISGIISYKFDENEEKYNLQRLDKINKEDIENEVNDYKNVVKTSESIKEGDTVARIVNNCATYVAISVNKDETSYFNIGNNVKMILNGEEIDAKVHEIHEKESDNIIIFKITNQNMGIYDTRVEEFDIIYKQIEGLKIPKSSIKVVDDNQGVYVVNQENKKTDFVKLDGVVYEDKDYVYLDCYKNDVQGIDSIKLYDEIILKPNSISKNIKIK